MRRRFSPPSVCIASASSIYDATLLNGFCQYPTIHFYIYPHTAVSAAWQIVHNLHSVTLELRREGRRGDEALSHIYHVAQL